MKKPIKVEVSGINKLIKNLNNLKNCVNGQEFLSNGFISSCSNFNNFEELAKGSPIDGKEDEAETIYNTSEWNEWIKKNTKYDSWQDMVNAAINYRIGKAIKK